MKTLGRMIIVLSVVREIPYDVRTRAADWTADHFPQCLTAVRRVQEYIKGQMGRR